MLYIRTYSYFAPEILTAKDIIGIALDDEWCYDTYNTLEELLTAYGVDSVEKLPKFFRKDVTQLEFPIVVQTVSGNEYTYSSKKSFGEEKAALDYLRENGMGQDVLMDIADESDIDFYRKNYKGDKKKEVRKLLKECKRKLTNPK